MKEDNKADFYLQYLKIETAGKIFCVIEIPHDLLTQN
jgi:hypothetical protein